MIEQNPLYAELRDKTANFNARVLQKLGKLTTYNGVLLGSTGLYTPAVPGLRLVPHRLLVAFPDTSAGQQEAAYTMAVIEGTEKGVVRALAQSTPEGTTAMGAPGSPDLNEVDTGILLEAMQAAEPSSLTPAEHTAFLNHVIASALSR